jgi:predicted acyltransferase
MAGMVIVNNPGTWDAVYAPLRHADWHGWTPTDLIFPWFLCIMGASMALAGPGRDRWPAVWGRAATLAGLGLFMAGFPFFNPERWRIPGVLMRIAWCYLAAAAVWRGVRVADPGATLRRLALLVAAICIGYWALLTFVAPPGGSAGDLSPAGNLGAWLDRALLGGHLWQPDWDPEGVLSTVPAVASTLLGLMAGVVIAAARPHSAARSLVGAGAVLVAAGLTWHLRFPINKSLWTSSYVLFTAGTAAVVLAAVHHALDDGRAAGWMERATEPLVALGRNAILLFVASGLVAKTLIVTTVSDGRGADVPLQGWIYGALFAPLAAPKVASLLYAAACLALLYALLAALHRRRWYWSV